MKSTTQFNLRMSPDEFRAIQAIAARTGQSMNAYIIAKCLETPAKQAKTAIEEPQSEGKPEGSKEPQNEGLSHALQVSVKQAAEWSGGYGKTLSSK